MHRVPKLRIHRSKRLAYVCLDGRQVYLGRAHSPEAQARYAALLADLRAGIRPTAAPPASAIHRLTVAEMAEAYLLHCIEKCGPSHQSTYEARYIARELIEEHAAARVGDFGPRAFKAIRDRLQRQEKTRQWTNRLMPCRCSRPKWRFFKPFRAVIIPVRCTRCTKMGSPGWPQAGPGWRSCASSSTSTTTRPNVRPPSKPGRNGWRRCWRPQWATSGTAPGSLRPSTHQGNLKPPAPKGWRRFVRATLQNAHTIGLVGIRSHKMIPWEHGNSNPTGSGRDLFHPLNSSNLQSSAS